MAETDGVLARIDRATRCLAEARTAIEAKEAIALADAAIIFARRIDASREVSNQAAEFRLRAELRLGEILKSSPKAPAGRKKIGSKSEPISSPTLAQAGIDRKLAARAQKLTEVPKAEFEKAIARAKEGDLHPVKLAKELAVQVKSKERKAASLEKLKKAASLFRAEQPGWTLINQDVIDGLNSVRDHHGTARLIFADPPYNIGVDYGKGKSADSLSDHHFLTWCRSWISACVECLSDDGSLWVMINDEYADHFGLLLREVGLHRRAWIKWYESFGVNCSNNFNRTSRHIFYCVRDPKKFVFNPEAVNRPSDRQAKYGDSRAAAGGKMWDDVWGINPPLPRVVGTSSERIAVPTQLPIALLRAIVGCASDPGDLVVDPFNGSGTTGAAAIELGRKYVGIDASAEFIELAETRLRALTMETSDGSKTA
jgi:site-specific DNA-methyltransferase (adenine-specific)